MSDLGRLTAEQCLRWVPSAERNVSRMVSSYNCRQHRSRPQCYVGRLKSATHIIPGKYIPSDDMIQTILAGKAYTTGTKEIQWPLLLTWFNFNPNMDK